MTRAPVCQCGVSPHCRVCRQLLVPLLHMINRASGQWSQWPVVSAPRRNKSPASSNYQPGTPQQPDTGQPPDNAPPNISQPKSLRSAVFSKVIFTLFKLILECKVSLILTENDTNNPNHQMLGHPVCSRGF